MTNVSIIGWYGTETIGDRAILAGLIHIFSQSIGELNVRIGCLDTLLTERTIDEDLDFYKRCSNQKLGNVSLFDSRIRKDLNDAINWGDLLIIGGGPLMEIDAMYMLQYAFERARKLHKKSIVAGCGMGPFKTGKLKKVAIEIIDNSSLAIFRDNKSLDIYKSCSNNNQNVFASIDPAAITMRCYKDIHDNIEDKGDYIAINFREPPISDYAGLDRVNDDFFIKLLIDVREKYNLPFRLVPMHTFWVGDDDRFILNRISRKLKMTDISVDNKPLSLEETMCVYANAALCIGMRFHAVLFQILLNGKNYILDYTDPEKGKIINLLNQLSLRETYENRYVSLVNVPTVPKIVWNSLKKVVVDNNTIEVFKNIYTDNINKLLL